jgi:hypothetical protein
MLASRASGSVTVIERATLKTRAMPHGFKAPMDAMELPDGSLVVLELGTPALVRA